jgi:hypothetical protein
MKGQTDPNSNGQTGQTGLEYLAQMPQGYNLDHGDYLGFTADTAKAEIDQMKQRIESLKSGLKVLPYAQQIAELETEFYKKLAALRKAIIRREISKKRAEAELRVALQALGIALDKIMGNEADQKTRLISKAAEWKQKADQRRGDRQTARERQRA